jgi:hypothetical protein
VVVTDLDQGPSLFAFPAPNFVPDHIGRLAKAEAVVQEIKKSGGDAIAVGGDVTAEDFPKKLISETIKSVSRLYFYGLQLNFLRD